MKKFFTMMIMVLAVAMAMAQAPEKFTYQAVVRNASNQLVANAPVGVRVSILQGGVNGALVYMETLTATTNANGLITLQIGGGNVQQGVFADIDWANGPFFLKTETDPNGGSDYTVTSTQQLLSVPYALYAREAGNVPQSVGELTNDANYITLEQVPAQVNADWDATEGAAQILNKPELFSGDYNDLTNKPTIPTTVGELTNDANYITLEQVPEQVNADWDATEGAAQILNKPELFSGDYNDLTNKPTIPTVPTNVSEFNNDAEYITLEQVPAQVNADWNATEGAAQILNKPTDVSAFTNDAGYITGYTETQTLADVTAQGNSAGNRQLKNVSDPTENLDAVNLRTLTSQINSLQDNFQQQMQQMQQQVSQMQQQIDSLQNIVNSLDTSNNTSSGSAVIDAKSCPTAPTVTDHEGNVYATVQIGNQCWMRDNLRTTTSPSTGTYLIPSAGTGFTYTGKQARWFNNDQATYAPMNYDLLYNWNAAVDTFNTAYGETSVNTNDNNAVSVTFNGHRRGICPAGWHLPSDAEWTQLTNYVSSQSEYQCGGNSSYIAKALASTVGWNTDTYNCVVGNYPSSNNATGFSAVPAGCCGVWSFLYAGEGAFFWSSTQDGSNHAYTRGLYYDGAGVYGDSPSKYYGFSVRCLRDETGGGTALTEPTVTTSAATDVTETSATLNGSISNPDEVAITTQGFEWKATAGGAYVAVNATGETMTYNLTGLTAGTSYTYRAFVTTAEGTSYGETVSFTTLAAGGTAVIDSKSCPTAPTVTDHEGNVYATVQIGNQCWMRDNLRTTTSPSTGTYLIPAAGTDYTCTGKQVFWYNNDSATYAPMNYGLMYNWNAAVDTFNTAYGETSVNTDYNNVVYVTFSGHRRGICPAGWHLPSDAEWTQLTNYVSSQSEYTCSGNSIYIAKALASTTGWYYDADVCDSCSVATDQSLNNASGFSAVPAGSCGGSSFDSAGNHAYFWSSTQYGSEYAYGRSLHYSYAGVSRLNYYKGNGYSVRCLRD